MPLPPKNGHTSLPSDGPHANPKYARYKFAPPLLDAVCLRQTRESRALRLSSMRISPADFVKGRIAFADRKVSRYPEGGPALSGEIVLP